MEEILKQQDRIVFFENNHLQDACSLFEKDLKEFVKTGEAHFIDLQGDLKQMLIIKKKLKDSAEAELYATNPFPV